MGKIVLYEGNSGTQNIVESYDDENYAGRIRMNDEARSMRLHGVRAGTKITVYDSKDGSKYDDYCVIQVKKEVTEYVVNTFERSIEDDTVSVVYVRNNGLDGKVSYIKIETA